MTKANLSLNGIAGTLWEIRRQEYVHWYLGYRQAVLIVNSLTKGLKDAELSRLRTLLDIDNKKKDSQIGSHVETGELKTAIYALEIEIAENQLSEQEQMVRDSTLELEVARREKSRIEAEHPEIELYGYQELQEKYAQEAFGNKLTRAIAISVFSTSKAIPEGAAEVIYDMRSLSETDQIKFSDNLTKEILALLPELAPSNTDHKLLAEGTFTNTGENNGFIFRGN